MKIYIDTQESLEKKNGVDSVELAVLKLRLA